MAEIYPNSMSAGIKWRNSSVYDTVHTYEFLNKDYTYILELYNGDKSVIFNHSQEYTYGWKNREKPHPKWPNDPTQYYFVYLDISKLYFEYESHDKFIEDFSQINKIVFKIKNNTTGDITTVFEDDSNVYYLTSDIEDEMNGNTLVSEVMDRLTLADITNIDSLVLDDNDVHMYGSLLWASELVKYMIDPEKTDEENYEYIMNNYKTYLTHYIFGYNTRIKHGEVEENNGSNNKRTSSGKRVGYFKDKTDLSDYWSILV